MEELEDCSLLLEELGNEMSKDGTVGPTTRVKETEGWLFRMDSKSVDFEETRRRKASTEAAAEVERVTREGLFGEAGRRGRVAKEEAWRSAKRASRIRCR